MVFVKMILASHSFFLFSRTWPIVVHLQPKQTCSLWILANILTRFCTNFFYKLNWYGIRGDALEWIIDFLSSRSQRVVLDGATSDSASVLQGVPQGTVLGPILFLIYISDLLDRIVNSTVRLIADACLYYLPPHQKQKRHRTSPV